MSRQKQRILVVDDEERIRRLLRMYLEKEDFCIEEVEDGEVALHKALNEYFSLIVLDVMLPRVGGIEICAQLRRIKTTPIIMLTAKGEETNRIQGFKVGADDYVVKPFSPREIIYRVKAVLRRSLAISHLNNNTKVGNNILFPYLIIEHDAHRVVVGNQEINLTPKEYELLHYLAISPDKVFSREKLLKDVWNYEFFGDLRTVDTHVKRLREKMNKVCPEAAAMITTVWGVGYKLEVSKVI